jgi:alpha-L-glutamate ligase-like protein
MIYRRLRQMGVLGINRRNIDLTSRHNPRRLYPLVDNKLRTKALCIGAGIPVPRLLAKAEHHFELEELMGRVDGLDDFVMKPARGAMGNGIVVITGRAERLFSRTGSRRMSRGDLQFHAASILSGLYALGGNDDMAMVEERLVVHPEFRSVAYDGVPDVRVIVYRGYPVMAMARLPTKASSGRANLHQGAIGVGLDMATGTMLSAVRHNAPLEIHPDTGERLIGRRLPDFERVLQIAVAAAEITGLGYLGADVVVDARHGPVILELNARPGLAIQLCNRAGLLPRLATVDRIADMPRDATGRLTMVKELADLWTRD